MRFDFEQQEADYILNVLADRPFRETAGLIQKIQQQAQAQLGGAASPSAPVDIGTGADNQDGEVKKGLPAKFTRSSKTKSQPKKGGTS